MAAELQANGFNAVPLDWTTISFSTPVPNWNGLQPGSNLVKTLALQTLGGPPPQSNAPPIPYQEWIEEEEEVVPPDPGLPEEPPVEPPVEPPLA